MESYEGLFSLGDAPASQAPAKKPEGDKLAEQRIKGLGMDNDVNIKRKSENFAVQLRKDRRQEALKKRKYKSGNENQETPTFSLGASTAVDIGCDPTELSIYQAFELQQ